jgi:predicted transcriptional regulator of viral defense system
MKWPDLLRVVADEPVFRAGLLAAGDSPLAQVRVELSRWAAAGKLIRMAKGLYALAPPYRKVAPHPFLVANAARRPSYVSMQTALSYYGMIPEYVPAVVSITSGRSGKLNTTVGRFMYRHVKREFFRGFARVEVAAAQEAFVATPEKALLDLVYLTADADHFAYLEELRLQNLERLDATALNHLARCIKSPKLVRAAKRIIKLVEKEKGGV